MLGNPQSKLLKIAGVLPHDYLRVLFTRKNGRRFLAYFFVAVDKEVSRQQAKQKRSANKRRGITNN